jgi:hypothetical protein
LFPPTNNQNVSIIAFAAADRTKNITAPVTITAFSTSIPSGTYVLKTSGIDALGNPFQRAAAIVLDGKGGVVLDGNGHAGEETVNFVDPNTGLLTSVTDYIVGGGYFVGSDGRGTLTVKTKDINLGDLGIETYAFVLLSSSQALITKMDFLNNAAGLSNNESSVGTMELQTSTAAPSGGYAFVTRGTDLGLTATAFGGVLNITSPDVSPDGSVFDYVTNDGSGLVYPSSSVSGTVSIQDSFGTFQISLNTDFGTIEFTAYEIDATHLNLIETDNSSGSGFAATSGIAIGQGSATGTFTLPRSFKGSFVFGTSGQDLSGIPNSLAAAGSFAASGGGSIASGSIDEIQSGQQAQVSDRFHATYTVDPIGSGRVDTNFSFTFSKVSNGTGPELVFYLTGNGGPVLILDADIEPALQNGAVFGAGVATGIAYPATTGASFSGSYGLSLTQSLFGSEGDTTGDLTAASQVASGVLDSNLSFVPTLGTQDEPNLTDGFQTSAVAGRLTGTISTPFTAPFGLPNVTVAYYLIDSNHGFIVETDGNFDGSNPGGLSFGYFATRAPICQGCP